MTHTIEDIKRLVPEWNNFDKWMDSPGGRDVIAIAETLLTTRAQLEVAVEKLEEITDEFSEGSDPWIIAHEALAKIKEKNDE